MEEQTALILDAVSSQRNRAMDNCATLAAQNAIKDKREVAERAQNEGMLVALVELAKELAPAHVEKLVAAVSGLKDRIPAPVPAPAAAPVATAAE